MAGKKKKISVGSIVIIILLVALLLGIGMRLLRKSEPPAPDIEEPTIVLEPEHLIFGGN